MKKRDAVPFETLRPCTVCGDPSSLAMTVTVCGVASCEAVVSGKPIPMILFCPNGHRHIDEGHFATKSHHTHACQECGLVWRPALIDTVGVQFLPGFKNSVPQSSTGKPSP